MVIIVNVCMLLTAVSCGMCRVQEKLLSCPSEEVWEGSEEGKLSSVRV